MATFEHTACEPNDFRSSVTLRWLGNRKWFYNATPGDCWVNAPVMTPEERVGCLTKEEKAIKVCNGILEHARINVTSLLQQSTATSKIYRLFS
jgi:hypothetical protein